MHAGSVHDEQEHQEQPPPEPVAEVSVAPSAPLALVVGAADDQAEVDADRRADAALARLAPTGEPAHVHGVRRSAGGPAGAIGLAGGALDGDTEQRLSSRLGRGGALDASVRRRMEGAFGTSFAGVNVHADGEADRLSRQMSATAFTVGKDVFFSQGAYRPGDSSGDRLIAHELAHVQQEGEGAHRRVHRAVGFEFETSVVVKKKTPKGGFEPYPKATVLKQYGSGFKMTADENSTFGSTIEWVVDPPVSEDDPDKLVQIMADMVADAQLIEGTYVAARDQNGRDAGKKTIPTVEGLPAGLAPLNDPDLWFLPDRRIQANPQITGGVDFAKVIDLMTEMGNGTDTAKRFKPRKKDTATRKADKETARKGGAALDRISPDQPGRFAADVKAAGAPAGLPAASKELQGLAALLVSYLEYGEAKNNRQPLNYAKLISNSTLVRTDFGALFGRLPEAATLVGDRAGFVDWILRIAHLDQAPDEKVFERGVRRDYHKAYKPGEKTDKAFDVTRRDWLTGIAKGYDALSAKSNPDLADKLEGLGALGDKFDPVGEQVGDTTKKKTGVIMEFRRMRQDVPVKDWTPLAMNVFHYLVDLNDQ